MNIFEKLFGKFHLDFNFLNRGNSPSNKATLKDSTGNQLHQAGRDINIGNNGDEVVSDLELQVMRMLYAEYRKDHKLSRWNVIAAHKELRIPDGTYVGILSMIADM